MRVREREREVCEREGEKEKILTSNISGILFSIDKDSTRVPR